MTMESLDRARMHPQNQGSEQQKAIKFAGQILRDFNVVDPGPKVETSSVAVPVEVKAVEQTFEIPTVSEKLYLKTCEALVKEGFTFVVAISPESIGQLAAGEKTAPLFSYIDPSRKMRSNIPPQLEVAIDPNNFRIEDSNNKSIDIQTAMIKERENALKSKLPEEVRNIISMIMPKHASIPVQLDIEHQKRTGKVLFTNWLGRTDDQTGLGHVAAVGRPDPADGLSVFDWLRGHGAHDVFALSVVVLPRKLAV